MFTSGHNCQFGNIKKSGLFPLVTPTTEYHHSKYSKRVVLKSIPVELPKHICNSCIHTFFSGMKISHYQPQQIYRNISPLEFFNQTVRRFLLKTFSHPGGQEYSHDLCMVQIPWVWKSQAPIIARYPWHPLSISFFLKPYCLLAKPPHLAQ